MRNKIIQEKLDKLNKDTKRMFQMIEHLPAEKLEDKEYGWSILQVLAHLDESEIASLKYMKKKVQAGDKMKDSGITNGIQMWMTNRALSSSLKWKAPSYISSPPSFPVEEIQSKWKQTRSDIQAFVDEYPDKWLNKLVYKHPMGGRQNLERAVDSFIYHQIHHIHQINRIKKQLGL